MLPKEDVKPLVSIRRLAEIVGRKPADIRRIASHSGRYYKPFDVRPLGGTRWRHIDNPTDELHRIQTRIYRGLLRNQPVSEDMHGGVLKKSISTNAAKHLRKAQLVTLDLHSCFPRIRHKRVYDTFVTSLHCSPDIASILTKLTTFQTRLPQGAPTSPMLANLVLAPLHRDIADVCRERALEGTMFVDDIAISGDRAFEVVEEVLRIIGRHGHSVRAKKLKRMSSWQSQQLTSLTLNKRLSVGRSRLRDIANRIFELANQVDVLEKDLRRVEGQIKFVLMIQPLQGRHLMDLADRLLPEAGMPGPRPKTRDTRECPDPSRHRRD